MHENMVKDSCIVLYILIFLILPQKIVTIINVSDVVWLFTLESGIDVGQGINVGPGKFVKKNKRRALNKCRA